MSGTAALTAKVESTIRVVSRLIAVLGHEVEMLRAMRVADIAHLQEEKAALIVGYEECVKSLKADDGTLAALEPALRDELARLASRFDETLAENTRALAAVRESHDRLLKAIVDAVAEQRASSKGYGANGVYDKRRNPRTAPTLSLSLDRRL